MDHEKYLLSDTLRQKGFPAKLWRLVNNPMYKSIHWDSSGCLIVINQQLFQKQILSSDFHSPDSFKTTNFSSFVRQLNLYGFKKRHPPDDHHAASESGFCKYFYHPNFQQNYPQNLAKLRRLTVKNKAKIMAGLDVHCWHPSDDQRVGLGTERTNKAPKRRTQTHEHSASLYDAAEPKALEPATGTPVPPLHLMRGPCAAFPPSAVSLFKEVSVSSCQHYSAVASNIRHVDVQQTLPTHANIGNAPFVWFPPHSALYKPSCYTPAFYHRQPNFTAADVSGHLPNFFSSQTNFQHHTWCSASLQHLNQDSQPLENSEGKKIGVNLDVVFKIADEVMQTVPSACLASPDDVEGSDPPGGSSQD